MKGALMIAGTASDVGKSHIATGLCRALYRRGVRVAPFKAQNMALNSFVTPGGHEIGRAQAAQAFAAGVEPEVEMNPILLKPTGERTSQVIVMGRPIGHLDAGALQAEKARLLPVALNALDDLRGRYEVVILEGAGGAAEINLLDGDIVNLRLAWHAGVPALIVADIDRGGAFASLYGTVELLPPDLRARVGGFVINKFRGDPTLLKAGIDELAVRTGIATLGVLPYLHDVALDAEDSLALTGYRPRATELLSPAGPPGESLDVTVLRFPRIANFTDFDPLELEPGVTVRFVANAGALGQPDLAILPGTKATVADLEWLRGQGFDRALSAARRAGTVVLGICGGYQMLGGLIRDGVESDHAVSDGLGWFQVETNFESSKVTRQRRGNVDGHRVTGYEIHHGRVAGAERPWLELEDVYGEEPDGCVDRERQVFGTSLHGLFECDGFRAAFLGDVARRRRKAFVPSRTTFAAARETQVERLADMVEGNLDMDVIESLIETAAA